MAMNMKSVNLPRGLLRVSLVLLACWFVGVVYLRADDLCAAYYWKSPEEAKADVAKWKQEQNEIYLQTGRGVYWTNQSPQTAMGFGMPNYPELQLGHASSDCFQWAPLDSERVRKTGGYAVDWSKRSEFLLLLLGYPIAFALALASTGAILMWIVKGFRHNS
jgi:hypothetical protein